MTNHLETLNNLRKDFPGYFEDKDFTVNFDDYLVTEGDVLLNESGEEWLYPTNLDSPAEIEPTYDENFSGFPGGNRVDDGSTEQPSIEVLAFYLPFHLYPSKWGVYIYLEGIQKVVSTLQSFSSANNIPKREQLITAKDLLFYHEKYHHSIEVFVTRLETVLEKPCYKSDIRDRYNKVWGSSRCYEETCANSYAREKVLEGLRKGGPKRQLKEAINKFYQGQPAGYREAAKTSQTLWKTETRINLFNDYLGASKGVGIPTSNLQTFWDLSGHWDRAWKELSDRVFFITHKNSVLARSKPAGLMALKTREFKKKLRNLGAEKISEGAKHEKWSLNGNVTHIGRHDAVDLNRVTGRAILGQLGVDEKWRSTYGKL